MFYGVLLERGGGAGTGGWVPTTPRNPEKSSVTSLSPRFARRLNQHHQDERWKSFRITVGVGVSRFDCLVFVTRIFLSLPFLCIFLFCFIFCGPLFLALFAVLPPETRQKGRTGVAEERYFRESCRELSERWSWTGAEQRGDGTVDCGRNICIFTYDIETLRLDDQHGSRFLKAIGAMKAVSWKRRLLKSPNKSRSRIVQLVGEARKNIKLTPASCQCCRMRS